MSEHKHEVGAAMWGPRGPLRRPVAAVPDPAGTIDVRDALALALIVCGWVAVLAGVQQLGGWWAVVAVLGVTAVAGGIALGYRGDR